jgi:hypothetical protein
MRALLLLLGPAAWGAPIDTDPMRMDPWAPPRDVVISGHELAAACAGVPALREAAMACTLDLQKAMRGLPALVAACGLTEDGAALPAAGFEVPHPLTVRAAAEAGVRAASRQAPTCQWGLRAQRVGEELLVTAPAASAAEELRLGWRTADGELNWMIPLDGNAAPEPGIVSRRSLIDPLLLRRGELELVVDILDSDGGTTRLTVPAELPEAEPRGQDLLLGPPLEVAVGAEGQVFPIAAMGKAGGGEAFVLPSGPVALDGPRAGPGPGVPAAPLSPAAAGALARWCRGGVDALRGAALSPAACTLLGAAEGRAETPSPALSPAVRKAAVDDLRRLPRNLGEELLRVELGLPAVERAWYRLDGALALAAAGAFFEAVLDGAPPQLALATWARSRAPRMPEPNGGEGLTVGFAADETHQLAPLSSSLYLASLLAAVAAPAEAAQGAAGAERLRLPPPPPGALLLAAATTLSRQSNLPGGVLVPWAQGGRPVVGEADRPLLLALTERLRFLHQDQAQRLARSRAGEGAAASELVAAGEALMHELDGAAGLLALRTGEDETARRARRLRLAALLRPLQQASGGWAAGDLLEITAALGGLSHDPTLAEQLPGVQEELERALTVLVQTLQADGIAPPPQGQITAALGLSAGLRGAEFHVAPTLPIGFGWGFDLRGGGQLLGLAQLVDPLAPLRWAPGGPAGPPAWRAAFAPGLGLLWRPTPAPLSLWPTVALSPGAGHRGTRAEDALWLGLSVGVNAAGLGR